MSKDCILEIRDLTLKHKGKQILDNINLNVNRGDIILLSGRNGAGKSTLLKSIAGIVVPDRGQITFLPSKSDIKTGFLSDNCSMYQDYSVQNMIKYHCRLHKIEKFQSDLLDRLIPNRKIKVKSLSTGLKAILLLTLTIATKPDLILIDEILQHIDPFIRETVLNQLIDMTIENQTALVIVNHFPKDLEKLPDRIMLIDEGKLKLDSTPEELNSSCRKLVTQNKLEQRELPVIHCNETGVFKEYYLYPISINDLPESESIDLTEAISSFIGGYYAG